MSSTAIATQSNYPGTFVARSSANTVQRSASPSTPQTKHASTKPQETPSPGRWRHPRLQELAKRRKRNTFDNSNVRQIVANAVALAVTWTYRSLLSTIPFLTPGDFDPSTQSPYASYIQLVLSTLFAINIYRAFLPLYKLPDNASDVDLNASQRSLLGLDPSATPPETPGTKYTTPPKYARSVSGSPLSAASRASALSNASGGSRASFNGSTDSIPSVPSRASSLSASFGSSARSSPGLGSSHLSTLRNTSDSPTYANLWQRKVAASRRSSLNAANSAASSPAGHAGGHAAGYTSGGSTAGNAAAYTAQIPSYGDRDAWMFSAGQTPPRRDEWRFVPNLPWRRSSLGGNGSPPPGTAGAAGAYAAGNSGPTAPAGTIAGASSKNSPLSVSLEGTGLWGTSLAASGLGGSVFRPDTPSPIGRPGNGVPLKNKWLYERGRDERRYS